MRLHINIDHVATLRNQRDAGYPDPVSAALLCERAGADGITAHLREDRRHIRDEDMRRLRSQVTTLLNFECAATSEMKELVASIKPDVVSLVPEKREERTTEGGLDVDQARPSIEAFLAVCRASKIKLSLFIEPEAQAVQQSAALGVDQIELHTGRYSELDDTGQQAELQRIASAAELGVSLGLEVAAGHGLTLGNVGPIAAIFDITELNIGHSVVSEAIFSGLTVAVRDLKRVVVAARKLSGSSP